MARGFTSTTYLDVDLAAVTGYPITMAAWFQADSITNNEYVIEIGDKDVANQYVELVLRGDIAGDPVRARNQNGGSAAAAASTTGYSVDTWHHGCVTFTDADNRAAFIDGGSKGTDATTGLLAVGWDRTSIGRHGSSSPDGSTGVFVAEAAVWSVVLSDAEIALLAKGFSPLFFQPQNLAAYWDLIRDDGSDRIADFNMAAGGSPTVENHPPTIIYPAPPFISYPSAVAANAPTGHLLGPLYGPLGGPIAV